MRTILSQYIVTCPSRTLQYDIIDKFILHSYYSNNNHLILYIANQKGALDLGWKVRKWLKNDHLWKCILIQCKHYL